MLRVVSVDGDLVIEPRFEAAEGFSEGLAYAWDGRSGGYIDKTGRLVIETNGRAYDFAEGLAGVGVPGVPPRYRYIDKQGNTVIPPRRELNPWGFSEGLLPVEFGDRGESTIGYINTRGETVIQARFHRAGPFKEGLAPVMVQRGGKWGYIDKDGLMVIPEQFDDARGFSEGLAAVELRGKCGYIGNDGEFAIGAEFEGAKDFSNGLAAVKVNGKCGYIDRSGDIVIEPLWNWTPSTRGFSEGLAAVATGGEPNEYGYMVGSKWGYVDRSGSVVIEVQFDRAFDFHDERARVLVGDERGYVDQSGKYVWGPEKAPEVYRPE